jgi:hypothetical protein
MRKFLWLIPVTLLASSAYAADKPAPKLELDPADFVCALGDVEAGKDATCTIKVKNTGDADAKAVSCKGKGIKVTVDPAKPAPIAKGADASFAVKFTAPAKGKKDVDLSKGTITCGKLVVKVTGNAKAAAAPAK